jgi:D-hexose-6-phosphate mutarotase
VSESETLADGSTRLKLSIADSEATMQLWPHRFRLAIDITVSDVLRVKLMATNTDNEPFICGGALHSYFNISSISNITIKGLAGCAYIDKVDQGRRKLQDGAVAIQRETDRIYLDTQADCIIEDSGMHRRIGIAKTGSRTTVVWNPWIDKARRMEDFGNDEYKKMVCVETVNAGSDVISLAPSNTHTLEGIIHLESLA